MARKKTYVELVREPVTVYWWTYREELVECFNNCSFDFLDKLGYHIWDDVDYDAEDVDGQYTELLAAYKKQWCELPVKVQAHKLMDAAGITDEEELVHIIEDKNYEIFQI